MSVTLNFITTMINDSYMDGASTVEANEEDMRALRVVDQYLDSPDVSGWLKQAIRDMNKRDICDMMADVDILKMLLNVRMRAICQANAFEPMGAN